MGGKNETWAVTESHWTPTPPRILYSGAFSQYGTQAESLWGAGGVRAPRDWPDPLLPNHIKPPAQRLLMAMLVRCCIFATQISKCISIIYDVHTFWRSGHVCKISSLKYLLNENIPIPNCIDSKRCCLERRWNQHINNSSSIQ